jgi:hypothetical protein
MPKRPRKPPVVERPKLTLAQILCWADSHFQRTGDWPMTSTRRVTDDLNEKWRTIDNALRHGLRGLPGGMSLARLLDEQRGVRNVKNLPPLTEAQILGWADDHHRKTGDWPDIQSGPVPGTRGEVWKNVNMALREGGRGLPGRSTLADLLERGRGVRNRSNVPDLTLAQILAWADRYHKETGTWPKQDSGPIPWAPGETWTAVDMALRVGIRGLRGGSSLARLLARERGVRNKSDLPRLTPRKILVWARGHRERTGKWPTCGSGPVLDVPGETWNGVNQALYLGLRGLPGRSSLSRLIRPLRDYPGLEGTDPVTVVTVGER